MKKKQEHHIGSLLGGALDRAGIMRQVGAAVIVQATNQALEELFGEGILTYAQCRSYVERTLVIACTHAAVAQEIKLQKQDVLAAVTRRVPRADVVDIDVVHRGSARRKAAWYDADQN